MGWSDRAIARTRLAAAKAIATSQELLAEADEEFSKTSPRYTEAKAALATAASDVRETSSRTLVNAGSTESGARVGGATRKAVGVLSELPILSAPVDAAKARHAIDVLVARFKEDPEEPMHAVQLAEGLGRMQDDLVAYRRVRTAIDPMYWLHRQVIGTAAQLGRGAADSTRTGLLKRAFVQARRRLTEVPDDPNALHALARVYLAQGDVQRGSLAAALSYRSRQADPLPLITLARCHMAGGEQAKAVAIARQAVSEGALYGNELLACLALKQMDRPHSEAAREFERLRAQVTPESRFAYLGCQPEGGAAWQTFKSKQAERTAKLAQKAKDFGDGLGT